MTIFGERYSNLSRNRWVVLTYQLFGAVAILFCIAYALRYVARYSVNVPSNDDWSYIAQYQEFLAHKIDFLNLLTRQDSGYRQPTMRLLWFPLFALTRVNLQAILVLHVFILIATCLGLLIIYRAFARKIDLVLFAPVAILLFSTGQSDGLLWAGTTPYLLANLGVVFALALVGRSNRTHFVLGLAASIFANYSYGNGFLVWPLTGLVLLMCGAGKKRWLAWFLVAALSCAFYMIGWQMLLMPALFAHSPSLAQVYARNPFDVYEFFFSILGMPLNGKLWFPRIFQFQDVAHPAVVGVFILVLFAVVLIQLVVRKSLRTTALPLALFLFGFLNCVLLTLGRVGDGEAGAYQTRYVIPTTLAAIGLYFMVINTAKCAGGFWRIAQWLCLAWIAWSVITIKIPDANAYGKMWQDKQLVIQDYLRKFDKIDDPILIKYGSGYGVNFLRPVLHEMKRTNTMLFAP